MRSFVKIKSSRIGAIALWFSDICNPRHCREFLMSQICVLTLFAKISEFTVPLYQFPLNVLFTVFGDVIKYSIFSLY